MTDPTCPLCDAPMKPASDLVHRGRVAYWLCSDRTCTGLVPAEDLRSEEPLGAPTLELMAGPDIRSRGGGGTRHRKTRRLRGDVRATFRERRYLDQDAGAFAGASAADRAPREERKPIGVRLPLSLAAWLEQASVRSGLSQNALVEALVVRAQGSAWCATCNLPDLAPGCLGGCDAEEPCG